MKKRKYTHIKELEPILLQMREDGGGRFSGKAGKEGAEAGIILIFN